MIRSSLIHITKNRQIHKLQAQVTLAIPFIVYVCIVMVMYYKVTVEDTLWSASSVMRMMYGTYLGRDIYHRRDKTLNQT